MKLEVMLRQLENDSDRDVRASTNVPGFTDDSRMDETVDTNRTTYLDETIECEPSASSVPEVVVVASDEDEEEQNQMEAGAPAEEKEELAESAVTEDTEEAGQRP